MDVKRRVSHVEKELLTFPEYLSSYPFSSGVRVTRSLVLCVCFVDRCLSFFFCPLFRLPFFDLQPLLYYVLFPTFLMFRIRSHV